MDQSDLDPLQEGLGQSPEKPQAGHIHLTLFRKSKSQPGSCKLHAWVLGSGHRTSNAETGGDRGVSALISLEHSALKVLGVWDPALRLCVPDFLWFLMFNCYE